MDAKPTDPYTRSASRGLPSAGAGAGATSLRGSTSTPALRGAGAKQRGIYSDFAASLELAAGPSATTTGSKRAPSALGFNSTAASSKYDSKLHAAAEVRVSRAAEPKVFVPHERRAGLPPRKVEVERKKRYYASQDLEELLQAEGVDHSKPAAEDGSSGGDLQKLLPIEAFDNTDYEVRSPAGWMRLMEEDAPDSKMEDTPGLPGRAVFRLDDGTGLWRGCRVVGYDDASERFRVVWDDVSAVAAGEEKDGAATASSAVEALVHRIDLYFQAEDPFNFAQRVGATYRARAEAESLLRYNLYLDCMPTDDTPKLDSEQSSRIVSNALSTRGLHHAASRAHALLKEANIDYTRAMNKIIFDMHLQHAKGEGLMALVSRPPQREDPPPPHIGVVSIPHHDFAEQFSDFSFHSHLTRFEVIHAIHRVLSECQRVLSAPLLNTAVTKTARLDEFEHSQHTAVTSFVMMCKDTWSTAIKNHIKSSLKDVGKGWFNLKDTNRDLYEFSKLKRFLTMVNFMMQDTLRFSVMTALNKYTAFLLTATAMTVDVKSFEEVEVTHPESASAPGRHRRPPLFVLDIAIVLANDAAAAAGGVEDGGAAAEEETKEESKATDSKMADDDDDDEDGERPPPPPVLAQQLTFEYTTDLESYRDKPVAVFEVALSSLQKLTQVERLVMDRLFWSHEPVMATVYSSEEWVQDLKAQCTEALAACLPLAQQYLATLDCHKDFLNLDVDLFIANLEYSMRDGLDLSKLNALVKKHRSAAEHARKTMPSTQNIGLFSVNTADVRTLVIQKHTDIAEKVLGVARAHALQLCTQILDERTSILSQLSAVPTNIESLTEIKEFQHTVPDKVRELEGVIATAHNTFGLLADFKVQLPREEFDLEWDAASAPRRIAEKMAATTELLEREKSRYLEEMEEEQRDFTDHLQSLNEQVLSLGQYTDLGEVDSVSVLVAGIKKQLEEAQEQSRLFNSREGLFDRDITEYEMLSRIAKTFEPYNTLWETTANWLKWHQSWMNDSFLELDPEQMEKDHALANKNMHRSVRTFEKLEVDGCLDIAKQIQKQVAAFRPHLPLVAALRNPGMRERHWKELSGLISIDVNPDEAFTLTTAFDLGLAEHLEVITKVGEKAGKEYQIEQALEKMTSEWEDVDLVIDAYRDSGTYILKGVDDLQTLLDEHVTMTQAMQFSAFKKPFEDRIETWGFTLSTVSDVLEEWIKVQRSWLYLQPIFDSADIQRQLPTEYKRFSTVDKNWRNTLKDAKSHPKAIKFCANEKLLEKFQESNKFLDLVQKGLSDYLETKRAAFSRFYFLSNDELLEILSQTKDPTRVQPHLKKCFEGIRKVTFGDENVIMDMISAEGEHVAYLDPIDPKGKNVEMWMNEVEAGMRESFKDILWRAIVDYKETDRIEWIQKWPGQAVLNGSQLHWTTEIEDGMRRKGNAGVKECYANQLKQLADMVELVRGKLEKLVRCTMGALTVVDVHARDVTKKLVENGVKVANDFEWISQMRYYWRGEQDASGDMKVTMVSSERPYGYEYIGNSFRLVITPLTDKCYMTLMGALQMMLGGAPAGPAGTGKTETVKDLAKALAKQCVVFNCSDGLDYLAMGKFFKGLASCGAWACFDEFNRIDIEVLSVVAQQIMTLQNAVKTGNDRIVFEDSEITVSEQFAVFITMNPGYAGRTELPDNLKALFRPVAMMVPDYAMIGEIMLFSFGFSKGLVLANKMVTSFKLCSEQLSSQDHYDYGMRAVKTVITAAGNLKRQDPDMDEDKLLLRALRDVNLPKFLAHDLPLYQGIMSDLFPGVEPPHVDYGDMEVALKQVAESLGLQPVPVFITKCIQLYETIVVRHGLMIVGPTGGGKSAILKTLHAALSLLASAGRTGPKIHKTMSQTVNPKSITSGQLYGEFDKNTHEWQDGIVADLIRQFAKTTTPDNKFIVFDGPVDTLWIENLNTVLDDNKKLCLVSGEIIALSDEMNIIFEVEDLAVASPATVSRCGMVYTEPTSLGLDPMIQSWLQTLPKVFTSAMKAKLSLLLDAFLSPTLAFLRRHLVEPVPTVDNQLCRSVLNLLDCFFARFYEDEARDPPTAEEIATLARDLDAMFMYSLTWGAAATTNQQGRKRFDAFLRSEMRAHNMTTPFPDAGLIYDFSLVLGGETAPASWEPWMSTVPDYTFNSRLSFAELIIPTKDSVRYKHLAKELLTNGKFVLTCGPTGTGKTVNMSELLGSGMPDSYVPLFLTFSAQTSANQTQDIVDSKMEKRRRGVFGPTAGTKYILFVDDLNMPQREEYFAQPPIELLRQWCNSGGWYDRKERQFKRIIDTILLAAMGPPGGGRNPVTPRLIRYFNVINYTEMDDESMHIIFHTILSNFAKAFHESIQDKVEAITRSTINVYNTIILELLPTPSKPHYTFNLRDLGKVFQGLLMADHRKVQDLPSFLRMWVHECRRVFQDRLVNDMDRAWFDSKLETQIKDTVEASWDDIVGDGTSRILFGDYMVPGADPRIYEEVKDMTALVPTIEEYLADYNAESKTPMKLVMFLDAVEHVSRLCRIMRQPQGNALLFGVGGSGRQSLTKLATFISDYDLFQIEISKGYGPNEWREDLKMCLLKAGVEGKPTVFLFADTQIIFEGMLEDVNNVLNSGDVPNLYTPEDMETIMNTCRRDCLTKRIPPTKINIFAQYLIRVRRNIHVVVTMSPMGEKFRSRLRMFPGLVNCCTIDWFSEWPDDALVSVAMQSLTETDLALGEHLDGVVAMFRTVHQGVAEKSKEYFAVLLRYNYVTPTSYLELLQTFKGVLAVKREEVGTLRSRLQIGLDKLTTTAAEVAKLQTELTAMEPQLVATQKEVDEMIVKIDADKETAAETKAVVEKEEADAQVMAAETKAIADDAERDLAEALPALDAAVACLNKLKKSDIDEVRAMKKPPQGVRLTMQAACIMFEIKPVLKPDPDNIGKKIKDYWEAAQKSVLQDANKLLTNLKTYDKDNIKDRVIQEVEPFMTMPEFTPEAVDRSSKACSGICMWVRAMYKYYTVALQVEPKKKKLAAAQETLDRTMATLNAAQAKLKDVMDRIAQLEASFAKSQAQKQQLEEDVQQCRARLVRAQKLIGGLGGEKDRWTESVANLTQAYANVVGDALVSASTIAYLGAFTSEFRTALVDKWRDELVRLAIPHTEGVNVLTTLADPVEVRAWNLAGLPTDTHSVQNAVIMAKARRWPLLIDPQGQANRYIKNLGKDTAHAENGMDVIRQSDKKFLQSLENGVRFGKWILLENIGEALDAALEPILLQQKFKQSGAEMIKLGDSVIPYNDSFRFLMTTKLPNPHYPPEVAVKVSLLNFTITPKGLEDQMLGVFVVTELPELEDRKNQLMLSNARMKKELQEIENKILYLLSHSEGNILDDEDLIETLAQSKVTSAEIIAKVAEAEQTEAEIDSTREKYRPVAFRASILYFAISDLASVDPMYQYSLPWFTALFVNSIRNSEQADDPPTRITNLNDYFTYSIYTNVCRSLFERHKLLFSFLMTARVLEGDGRVDPAEWRFLISAQSLETKEAPNPAPQMIVDRAWSEVCALAGLPAFAGLETTFADDLREFKPIFDSSDAHRLDLPKRWSGITHLQRMCLLRCLRPDRMTLAIQDFVSAMMGERFISPPPFDLKKCFEDSHVASPLVFVLSRGSDPTKAFYNFAESFGMASKTEGISLGQGQGVLASRLISEAQMKGSWVLLQNCHLAASWMPELERICEAIEPDKVSKDFRLWLTSMPTKAFPVSVLQNGVKMTNEPPKGLRANLKNFYFGLDDEALQATRKPAEFRKLLFGLSFFHANVQDRKKFGALGWNIPYEFNDSDLEISRRQLEMFLDEYDNIPYKVLNFLTSYINYGGRVTDDKDLRTIDVILKDYFAPKIMEDGYAFSSSGLYHTIEVDEDAPHDAYMKYIDSLPFNPDPEAFGMHANANITSDQNEAYETFDTLLSLQPRTAAGGGKTRDEIIADLAQDIASRIPPPFDVEAIQMQYPVKYEDSMNTVLVQECLRYNKLVDIMTESLREVQKALKGLVVMSVELDAMGTSMFNQKVPTMWESLAYPSLKPLNSWVSELVERLTFIQSWVDHGPPAVFWISGFFFPQAFLTGTLQNFARKYQLPIDSLSFSFGLEELAADDLTSPPSDGCFIRGLFLEGARYDPKTKALNDSLPKQLYTLLPVMHLLPVENRELPTSHVYRCPVYKILSRQGSLSTTGHSTNFVMYIELPSNRHTTANNVGLIDCPYWIKAGVAAFCALRY